MQVYHFLRAPQMSTANVVVKKMGIALAATGFMALGAVGGTHLAGFAALPALAFGTLRVSFNCAP